MNQLQTGSYWRDVFVLLKQEEKKKKYNKIQFQGIKKKKNQQKRN